MTLLDPDCYLYFLESNKKIGSSGRTRTYNPPVNSLVGCSKFNNFAAQMTTHEHA
jgi:hypothetical protein